MPNENSIPSVDLARSRQIRPFLHTDKLPPLSLRAGFAGTMLRDALTRVVDDHRRPVLCPAAQRRPAPLLPPAGPHRHRTRLRYHLPQPTSKARRWSCARRLTCEVESKRWGPGGAHPAIQSIPPKSGLCPSTRAGETYIILYIGFSRPVSDHERGNPDDVRFGPSGCT